MFYYTPVFSYIRPSKLYVTSIFQTVTFQVAYITAGECAFAFYSYAKNRMLFDSVRVFIGHMYGGDIYGEYDNNDGTKLLRPDLNLVLDSTYLGFDCLFRFLIEFSFLFI